MFEQWQSTITANTTEANPVRRECKISQGVLKKVAVYFPFGVEYYARCRVLLGQKPLLPRSSSGYVTANGVLVDTGEIMERVREDLPVLAWEVWNLDDTNNHTLTLSATWVTKEEADVVREIMEQSNRYLEALAKVITGGRM